MESGQYWNASFFPHWNKSNVNLIKEVPFKQFVPRSVPIIWKDEFVRNYSKTEMKAVLDVANETYGE